MDQAGIIRDLLSWLESHLDQPLSLDNVAAKAGYSKWHLQRMFKDITGNAIGAYIRARRLSKAAVALRLTSRPILDIALQYRFDSQQTFTRAFKKQFAQTPALYRRHEDWNAFGICPPLRLGAFTLPQPEYVTLPDIVLVGVTQSYSCSLEQITHYRAEMRSTFWQQYLSEAKHIPCTLYGLHLSSPSHDKDDEQEAFYTTAIAAQDLPENETLGQPVILHGGEFAQFTYEGSREDFQNFILTLYTTCLPELKLTRRKGHDIERFSLKGDPRKQPPTEIHCRYMIPIRR